MNTSAFWWQSADGGLVIGNSLRFRGAQSLSRTMTGAGAGNETVSYWIKLGKTTDSGIVMSRAIVAGSSEVFTGHFGSLLQKKNGSNNIATNSAGFIRDPSAWYHVVITTKPTGSEIFVNGVSSGTSGDTFGFSLAGHVLRIGSFATFTGIQLNGYLADFHFVDGTVLDPTSFGEFNADGVWVPKMVSGVTYGTNGFYLDFSDPNDIGADRSGNGNNFTPTGFELTTTTSTNYDWMADSPTDNYPTINSVSAGLTEPAPSLIVNANLSASEPSNANRSWLATVASEATGKFYAEYTCNSSAASGGQLFGIADLITRTRSAYRSNGTYTATFGGSLGGSYSTWDNNDIISIAWDTSTGNIWYAKNNAWQSGNPATNTSPTNTGPAGARYSLEARFDAQAYARSGSINYGQRPFTYTPPTGFKALSTAGLPAVAITKPSDHFTTILDTGANILTAAKAKFSNGLWWIKDRANSNQHQLVDSLAWGGATECITCPNLGTIAYQPPAGNSVAWCWNLTDGSNGFDIVTGTNAPVAHRLGQDPQFAIYKNVTTKTNDINVYHAAGTSTSQRLKLNSTDPVGAAGTWNINSSTFYYGGTTTDTWVAYLWAPVPGYSSIGRYVGNGNADGPFVYTGFRPAFVMTKRTDSNSGWYIHDVARNTYNPLNLALSPDLVDAEVTANINLDILSNGFKLRTAGAWMNASGGTYIYIAFAENPFGGSNVSPAPAR